MNIKKYLEEKGIEIIRDDGNEYACLCPFHNNANSPAFYINSSSGLWICFNPSCAKRGSVRDLMTHYGDSSTFVREYTFEDIEKALEESEEVKHEEPWDDTLDKIRVRFPDEAIKVQYLLDRGFAQETLDHFEIGYSDKKKRIVIPIRDEHFHLVGFIGRATDEVSEPKYLNSKGLPKKTVVYNLSYAKEFEGVIVVEGCLDAMKVWQSGYPNVVATFGATVTEQQCDLLKRYFNTITVFADNDHAGYAMVDTLVKYCGESDLHIVFYDDPEIHDPGQMSPDILKSHVDSSKGYLEWILG